MKKSKPSKETKAKILEQTKSQIISAVEKVKKPEDLTPTLAAILIWFSLRGGMSSLELSKLFAELLCLAEEVDER